MHSRLFSSTALAMTIAILLLITLCVSASTDPRPATPGKPALSVDGLLLTEPAESGRQPLDDKGMELSFIYAGSALWQGTNAVAGSGNIGYSYPYFGLQVYDLTNPLSPALIGECFRLARAYGMAIDGDFVYVAAGTAGLLIFDVSDPYRPVLAGEVNLDGLGTWGQELAQNVEIVGQLAYVSAEAVMAIVDISDPYAPQLVRHFVPWSPVHDAVISGNYAILAGGGSILVYDLSVPGTPPLVESVSLANRVFGLARVADQLYAADYSDGMWVLNAASPLSLQELGEWTDTATNRWLEEFAVVPGYAYIGDWNEISIVDATDPSSPNLSGIWDFVDHATGMYSSGDDLFMSGWGKGISRWDISSPAMPAKETECLSPGMGYEMVISGQYGFQANGIGGLQVLDLSDPETPTVVGSFDTEHEATGIALSGQHAFMIVDTEGLKVYDISVPATPTLVAEAPLPGLLRRIKIQGNYAYATAGDSGLIILDISDPGSPQRVSSIDVPGYVYNVAVDDGHAFVSSSMSGLHVVDVSDPSAPAVVGSYINNDYNRAVVVSGDHVYLQYGGNLSPYRGVLGVFDVSNPSNPVLITSLPEDQVGLREAVSADVIGSQLHVSGRSSGLKVFDISTPTSPRLVGQYDPKPGYVWDTDLAGGVLWVTCDNGLISVYQGDCSGPDGSGGVNVSDLVFLVNYLFKGGPAPLSVQSGDINCDGGVSVADVTHLVNFLFKSGAPPCGGCY